MPGLDGNQMLPGHRTPDYSLQLDFLDVLAEMNMHQLVTEPTYLHRSTLDLTQKHPQKQSVMT